MENQIEEKNTEMGNVITRSEEFIRKNQKTITIIAAAIVAVALIIFCVVKFYVQPREQRAADEMFYAENYYNNGDFQKALEGDDNHRGFVSLIDAYGSTKSGNLAKLYAGIANLRLGNYDQAVKYLKDYNGKDLYTKPIALMAEADALAEQENYADAAKLYLKAAAANENDITSPSALYKAGLCYLKLGDNANALKAFEQLKSNYPFSYERSDSDRFIALAEAQGK